MAVYTTIDDPTLHFQAKIYTGNGTAIGSGGQAITLDGGTDMQPDFVWIKDRTDTDRPRLFDAVRGVTKELDSSDNTAETTLTEGLTAFGSDGFTVGNHEGVNSNTDSFVAWCWKAGGSTASNSSGDITSTVSVNTTSKFSIVSYEGNKTDDQTVGHSLGVVPEMIITKPRDIADNWGVYHKSMGNTHGMYLNATNAKIDSVAYWSDADPTSTLVTLGENEATNDDESMIMYAFAPVQGFSKFGDYAGNGNADGTFVYTGFKPAWVMVKRYDGAGQGWNIWDNKRDTFNLVDEFLIANSSNAEATGSALNLDFLSNGFKFRGTDGGSNTSGSEYVYMAFAESPFVNSNGVPNNAR